MENENEVYFMECKRPEGLCGEKFYGGVSKTGCGFFLSAGDEASAGTDPTGLAGMMFSIGIMHRKKDIQERQFLQKRKRWL